MSPITNDGKGIVTQRLGGGEAETEEHDRQTGDPAAPTESGNGGRPDATGGDGSVPDPDSAGDADSESQREALPLDQVFEILKNSRRRQTLHYLDSNGGEASLSDLAEHIAAIENDVTLEAITSSQRKRVYVGLYQCHLPKMDDMEIIDFEKNRGTVELARNADQLRPYLDREDRDDWHWLYAGVTAVGIGLFGVSALGSAPLGLTPPTVLGALLLVMGLCSVCHVYVEELRDEE
jgi:DNA-binding transcriptional ArsR family regulator